MPVTNVCVPELVINEPLVIELLLVRVAVPVTVETVPFGIGAVAEMAPLVSMVPVAVKLGKPACAMVPAICPAPETVLLNVPCTLLP